MKIGVKPVLLFLGALLVLGGCSRIRESSESWTRRFRGTTPDVNRIWRDVDDKLLVFKMPARDEGYRDDGAAIMQEHNLLYLSLRELGGQIYYREFRPGAPSPEITAGLEEDYWKKLKNAGQSRIDHQELMFVLRSFEISGKQYIAAFAYRKPYFPLLGNVYQSAGQVLRAVGRLFREYGLFVLAGIFLFLGLLLLIISLAGGKSGSANRDSGPDSEHPEIKYAFEAQVVGSMEPFPEARPERREQQELWNLPGFQSLSQVGDVNSDAERRKVNYQEAAMRGASPAGSLFAFKNYNFKEMPDKPGSMADLDGFLRTSLLGLKDRFEFSEVLLYLRNNTNRFQPILQVRGNAFLASGALREKGVADDVFQKILGGAFVVSEDGYSVYFPIPTKNEVIGILLVRSNGPLYNPDHLSSIWAEIKKFGELLFQAKISEQASVDPESTLLNGIQFYNALDYEYSLRHELAGNRGLYLLNFHGELEPNVMRAAGLLLRDNFSEEYRLFRIAADVFALLGPGLSGPALEKKLADYLLALKQKVKLEMTAGGALLEAGFSSSNVWFQAAGASLKEAGRQGMNHFHLHRHKDGRVTFKERKHEYK